jgi:hypothetical protein
MSIAEQARILDDEAKATSKRMLRDHRNAIEPHEETLTQNFVSEYVARVRRAKMRVSVNEFTRRQEARLFGADLAIWFTNSRDEFAWGLITTIGTVGSMTPWLTRLGVTVFSPDTRSTTDFAAQCHRGRRAGTVMERPTSTE